MTHFENKVDLKISILVTGRKQILTFAVDLLEQGTRGGRRGWNDLETMDWIIIIGDSVHRI